MAGNRLRNCNCFQASLALQSIIESPQEFPPGLRVILPGILSVEDHRHYSVAALGENWLSCALDVAQQVCCGLLRVHARADEADEVRDGVVAKHHVHRGLAVLITVNVMKLLRKMTGKAAIAVALEEHTGAATEHTFVGGHPLDTETVCDGQRLFRDAAFRRPHALRPHSEDLLVKIESAHELLARVLGVAKAVLRQG